MASEAAVKAATEWLTTLHAEAAIPSLSALLDRFARVAVARARLEEAKLLAHNWYGFYVSDCECRDCAHVKGLQRQLKEAEEGT